MRHKREAPWVSGAFLNWGRVMATGGVPVEQELSNIMSQLTNAGVRIDVHEPNSATEIFVAELPSGKQYIFSRGSLMKMRDDGKLNIPGVEEFGVTR